MHTSSRGRIVVLLASAWALAAATAGAQDVLYLHAGAALTADAPAPSATTIALSARIPVGESVLLGTFASAPVAGDVMIGGARAVVYLATGRPGMDGCANVTMSLSRLTGTGQSVAASGALTTSIQPRRRTTDPIIVPMALVDPLVAASGDRIVFQVRVANACGGERTVSLLYGSVARASRVELVAPGVTTTTVTTTSTTTTIPPTCLETATGLAAVRCRLEAMDAVVRSTSPAMLGGPRLQARLARRIVRGLSLVRAAELIEATPRRLRRASRQVARFVALVERGQGDGRVATDVGGPLLGLARGANGRLQSLLAAR